MQITVISRGIDLESNEEDYARRRLGFALGRFSDRVARTTVTLGDANGPRGGVDKFCRISVSMKRGEPFSVTAEAATVREVIDLAADRAKRAIARRLDRLRSGRPDGIAKSSQEAAD